MTQDQENVLRLMPCAYDGWAPRVGSSKPVRRSIIIDQLAALGLAIVSDGMATLTPAGNAAIQ